MTQTDHRSTGLLDRLCGNASKVDKDGMDEGDKAERHGRRVSLREQRHEERGEGPGAAGGSWRRRTCLRDVTRGKEQVT